ncbi:MAG TPA: AAA family ATPase [Polyangiales bacterium]|nr:AAA family ATPase [Polyangiales bacterium]
MSLTYDLTQAQALAERLRARLKLAVRGRDEVIDLLLIALLADGHVLLEDFPGSGKTTLARALGEAIATDGGDAHIASFRRIQFTPDLLPSDVTGTTVFEPQTHAFVFRRGPVFAHVVLADEINRTSPKVQAAMLEAMAEKQVTIDDTSHPLDELFFVIATQNPLDLAGTYPLPRPQLDRFLFKIRMTHIARADELQVLTDYPAPRLQRAAELPGARRSEVIAARTVLRGQVAVHAAVREALVDIATALRNDNRLVSGVSTRSLVLLLPALQARALVRGRDYVSPEDVAALAPHVFAHRIEPAPGIDDTGPVVRDALTPAIEKLARMSLAR